MLCITVNALIKRASLYLQSDEREKTFLDFEMAEELDPNNPDLYLHRGQSALQKGFLPNKPSNHSLYGFEKKGGQTNYPKGLTPHMRATEILNILHSRGRRISNLHCKQTGLRPPPPGAY
ncbi:hypothetical protein J6590_100507 [Homalodisca vitripennis]|nr:hypothetical protein J6590_100507 [Homalodisca vitripennis]